MKDNGPLKHYEITEQRTLRDGDVRNGNGSVGGDHEPQLSFAGRPISFSRAIAGGVVLLLALIIAIVVSEDGKSISESFESGVTLIVGLVISFAIWLKR